MRQLITAAILLAITTVPAAAQGTNFDGTGAPCIFANTGPLTTQFSGQGLTFSGNGAILNQCGSFVVGNAHSGTDFAGYNTTFGPVSESILFSSVQNVFEIYIGSANSAVFTFYLNGNEEDFSSMLLDGSDWTKVAWTGAYDRVDIESSDATMTLDDLNVQATVTPEPASMALFATGLIGLGAVVRRRKQTA